MITDAKGLEEYIISFLHTTKKLREPLAKYAIRKVEEMLKENDNVTAFDVAICIVYTQISMDIGEEGENELVMSQVVKFIEDNDFHEGLKDFIDVVDEDEDEGEGDSEEEESEEEEEGSEGDEKEEN